MYKLANLLLFLVVIGLPEKLSAGQLLAEHSSPYLRLHANDPVNWRVLDNKAIELAKKQQRLIFISSGYFACHWCHVMQQESFQDAAVAEVVNKNFVAIKLDREQHQAIDKQLLEFVRRVRGYAGWPLNVVLTPEGYPITGFVYLPRDEFIGVLNNVQTRWQQNPERLSELAHAAAETLSRSPAGRFTEIEAPTNERLMVEVRLQQDELQGGFGIQAKFPRVPLLLALFSQYRQQPDEALADFLRLTLEQMASKGLRDHINGGFFRYTTTPDWLIPHYEKMLVDNALLVTLFAEAEKLFPGQGYLQLATDTADAMKKLFFRDGLYRSSLSAVDQQGNEGAAYLWTEDQVKSALSNEKLQSIALHWFGFKTTASQAASMQLMPVVGDAALAKQFSLTQAELRKSLRAIREQLANVDKPVHALDDKALLGNNALAVSSLLGLAQYFPDDSSNPYAEHAMQLLGRIRKEFQIDRQWYRQSENGHGVPAELEDLAYLVQALWGEYQIRQDKAVLDELLVVLERCWTFYEEDQWRMARENVLPWHFAAAALPDTALPAPPAIVMKLTRAVRSLEPDALSEAPLNQAWENARRLLAEDVLGYASYW